MEGKFEWGLKSNLSRKDDSFGYLSSDSSVWIDGVYVPHQSGGSVIRFFSTREDVHAGYATYGRKWGVWGTQGGMRLEQVFTAATWEGNRAFEKQLLLSLPFFQCLSTNATMKSAGLRVTAAGSTVLEDDQLTPFLG